MNYTKEIIAGLELPPDPNFRQFKMVFEDGKAIKIKKIINSPKDLEKTLLKFQPKALYVSTSKFLNPHRVAQKKKNWGKPGELYKTAQNLFLGGDLVIDFDEKRFEEVKKALEELITKHGLERFEVIQTGRGYHLWCLDFYKKICVKKFADPSVRENYFLQKKRKILTHLKEKGVVFDFNTSLDVRRVVRVIGSIYKKENIQIYCRKVKL